MGTRHVRFNAEELSLIKGMAEYSFPKSARPALAQGIIDKIEKKNKPLPGAWL